MVDEAAEVVWGRQWLRPFEAVDRGKYKPSLCPIGVRVVWALICVSAGTTGGYVGIAFVFMVTY